TPRARRIAENLGRRALYVGITAVLAVPVWFATRGHFDGTAPSPNTASLDVIPAAVPVTPAGPGSAAAAPAEVAAAPVTKPTATPYVASLAPVPRAAPAAAANLDMQFSGDSWVDIAGPDGGSVEKALIKAGETRSFTPGQVARVTLGNASAVQVQQNGAIVDLTPYQRANVARFQVSSEGSVVPVSH
ncbi:DUF4115 domain-containing protein, partial [Stenotrophomonas indicatrix]